jgi:hypothetical protein
MDVIIKKVRLSFPSLFTATEFKAGDGKPRWSASFIIEPGSENDKAIEAAIEAEAKETWGDKYKNMLAQMRGQSNKDCYLAGNARSRSDGSTYDGYEGMKVLTTHRPAIVKGNANARPLIINTDKSVLMPEDGRPYAGCYVNAKISIYCQKGENPGVRASFSVVQFHSHGEAFSSSTPSADEFEAIKDEEDSLV